MTKSRLFPRTRQRALDPVSNNGDKFNYERSPVDGNVPAADYLGNNNRVLRGGSWRSDYHLTTVSVRTAENPEHASNEIGFRVVRIPK